jgi:polysaccharide biosynthesis/export protein VpsN
MSPRVGACNPCPPNPHPGRTMFVAAETRRTAAMPRLAHVAAILLAALGVPIGSATAQRPNQAGAAAPSAAQGADALRPGDVVRLRIWREPELSGDFTIDEAGVVTLPKVGPVQATDQPVDSLKARLLRAYRVYLTQPSIEVIPLRRIQVAGAVRNPGLYTVDPTMTIADVITLAGGATPQGRRDRVILVRGAVPTKSQLSLDARSTQWPLRSGDQLVVPERSWIGRNPGVVIGAVSATASVIYAIARLRP